MKKLLQIVVLLSLAVFSSCVSKKEVVYLQGIDSISGKTAEEIALNYTLKVQEGDLLSIKVAATTEDILLPFGANAILGQTGRTTSSYNNEQLNYYEVDKEGNVNLPLIGEFFAKGMTCEELEQALSQRLKEKGYLYDGIVNVKIMNFKVSVLGAVSRPGQVSSQAERLTILQAIAQCGDLTTGGLRKNVLVIREQDGQRTSTRIDLTSPDLLNSPYYYLKQNDVIYVEPNSSIRVQSSPYFTFWNASSSILSLIVSIVSLIAVLK